MRSRWTSIKVVYIPKWYEKVVRKDLHQSRMRMWSRFNSIKVVYIPPFSKWYENLVWRDLHQSGIHSAKWYENVVRRNLHQSDIYTNWYDKVVMGDPLKWYAYHFSESGIRMWDGTEVETELFKWYLYPFSQCGMRQNLGQTLLR